MTILSLEEYKKLSTSLMKKKFNIDKSKNAIKGVTSSGHLIVRDASGSVELVPPIFVLNVYQDCVAAGKERSEFQRMLLMYIAEARETGQITDLQTSRMRELLKAYEESTVVWQKFNNILQTRLTSSIDSIFDMTNKYENLSKQLADAVSLRTGTPRQDTAAYKKSAAHFHQLNRTALSLTRELDHESTRIAGDQVFMIEAPSLIRDEIDIKDIRVKIP